jgi:hypothetical protein
VDWAKTPSHSAELSESEERALNYLVDVPLANQDAFDHTDQRIRDKKLPPVDGGTLSAGQAASLLCWNVYKNDGDGDVVACRAASWYRGAKRPRASSRLKCSLMRRIAAALIAS